MLSAKISRGPLSNRRSFPLRVIKCLSRPPRPCRNHCPLSDIFIHSATRAGNDATDAAPSAAQHAILRSCSSRNSKKKPGHLHRPHGQGHRHSRCQNRPLPPGALRKTSRRNPLPQRPPNLPALAASLARPSPTSSSIILSEAEWESLQLQHRQPMGRWAFRQ
jgi:hypothetical protein